MIRKQHSFALILFLFPLLLHANDAFLFFMNPGGPSAQKTTFSLMSMHRLRGDHPSGDQGTFLAKHPLIYNDHHHLFLTFKGSSLDESVPGKPQESGLTSLDLGFGYRYQMEDQKSFLVMGQFGSSSDHPFRHANDDTYVATLAYSFQTSEVSSWMFLLMMSNQTSFLSGYPIPGFLYSYAPSKELRVMLGVPIISVNWMFTENNGLSLFSLLPYSGKLQVFHSFNPVMRVYLGAESTQSVYRVDGRTYEREKLFYDERKVAAGFKSPVFKNVMGDLECGYSFYRRLLFGEKYSTSPNHYQDLQQSLYYKLSFNLSF